MEFYEDEPMPPMFDQHNHDDSDERLVEVYGQDLYDVPDNYEPTGVVVLIKGYYDDNEFPTLLFRASNNVAEYEVRAMLAEGIKEMLE